MTDLELIHYASQHTDQLICAAFMLLAVNMRVAVVTYHALFFTAFTALDWYVIDVGPQLWSVLFSAFLALYALILLVNASGYYILKLSVILGSIWIILQPVFYYLHLDSLDAWHNDNFFWVWYGVVALMFLGLINGARYDRSIIKRDSIFSRHGRFSRFFRLRSSGISGVQTK